MNIRTLIERLELIEAAGMDKAEVRMPDNYKISSVHADKEGNSVYLTDGGNPTN